MGPFVTTGFTDWPIALERLDPQELAPKPRSIVSFTGNVGAGTTRSRDVRFVPIGDREGDGEVEEALQQLV